VTAASQPVERESPSLERWYEANGRHALPWRATRDRWAVLVSEVMLHQTQVPRVEAAWAEFIEKFPTPDAMAAAGPGAVIEAWGRLGYPRRARRLWECAARIAAEGWPADLTELPGVGRYTANAVLAQADDADLPAVEVNVRRVVERVAGRRLTDRQAEAAMVEVGAPLRGRDRLLALMDVGSRVCRPHAPACDHCPLFGICATHGPLEGAMPRRQAPFEGSFRQSRGVVLARLRNGPTPIALLDARALKSLVADGLATVDGDTARLP
jgi:A/G-specific adenine glycosylase